MLGIQTQGRRMVGADQNHGAIEATKIYFFIVFKNCFTSVYLFLLKNWAVPGLFLLRFVVSMQ